MEHVKGLRCVLCEKVYSPTEVDYVCPECGPDSTLDVVYDYERIKKRFGREHLETDPRRSVRRYEPLLPIERGGQHSPLSIGWTPLYPARPLGRHLGLKSLYLKDDGRNPTASLKDRASAVAVSHALSQGGRVVSTASTGNAASSLAGLCASVGLECVIFVPASAPPAKLSQLLVFGAKVLAVAGTYDDAFDLCVKACDRYGWYCRNTGYNPYMAEGKKTVALEICEQLGFDAPDWLVVSAGDGCITDGVGKGLYDLQQLGFLAKMPRIASVQSTKSAAIYNAWKAGTEKVEPVEATTIADSISVGRPRDAIKALRAVRRSRGVMVTVEDEAILEAGRLLGRKAGVFAEPAGAAPLAGVLELMRRGDMSADDRVAVVVSGNGLKDAATASRGAGEPIGVQPDGSDLEDALKSLGVE
jgi:threonine synthase